MSVHETGEIQSISDFIQALMVCWASSGKPNHKAYSQGFIDCAVGAELITIEQARAIKEELRNHKIDRMV